MIYLFVLFLVAPSCFMRAFSSRSTWELPLAVICGLLTAVTSLAGERELQEWWCWAWLLHGMGNLPGPGIEPMSPAMARGFLTTVSSGKSLISF